MHPDAVVQSHIDTGAGLVDVTPAARDQPYGELTQLVLVELRDVPGLQSVAPIEPGLIMAVEEDIRDQGVGDQLS
jgi:hypothetical protein